MDVKHSLPTVQRLSHDVICILGQNPGPFTLNGTNSYLVGRGSRRILVDTSNEPTLYIPKLADVIATERCKIAAIVVTHKHLDHCGSVSNLLACEGVVEDAGISVYQFAPATADVHPETQRWTFASNGHTTKTSEDDCESTQAAVGTCYTATNVHHGDFISFDEIRLQVLHTPGHTDDSISLYYEAEDALFVGDCVLGSGSAAFENLSKYMKSLEALRKLAPVRLYCGHGPCIGGFMPEKTPDDVSSHIITAETGLQRIETYIKHRIDREAQVVRLLRSEMEREMSVDELVSTIYCDAALPPQVADAAKAVIAQHCCKLLDDGVVNFTPGTHSGPSVRGIPAHILHGKFKWKG